MSSSKDQRKKGATATTTPTPTTATSSKAPARISIENLEFMEKDQKQKELLEKVNRHKSQNRMQRHRRNESFGKTPSISELPVGTDADTDDAGDIHNLDADLHDNQDWLLAVQQQQQQHSNSLANLDYTHPHSHSHSQYPHDIHKKQSYMVPLQDNSPHLLQQQQQQQAPWPATTTATTTTATGAPLNPQYYQEYKQHHRRSLSNSSSQGGGNTAGNTSVPAPPTFPPVHPLKADPSQQQQPIYPEYMDDEYASLLQQNFAVSTGAGAAGYGATTTGSPLPPTGRNSMPPHYPPPQQQQQRRSRDNSRSPHYQPHKSSSMPSYTGGVSPRGGRSFSEEERGAAGLPPPPPPPPPPPSASHPFPRQTPSPGRIHRRSHSDNYAKLAMPPPPPPTHQQHPLLPRGSPLPPPTPSSPGHRRVRSSGSGIANLRNNSYQGQQQQQAIMGSASSLPQGARSPSSRPPAVGHHRRSSSLASYSSNAVSVQSEASFLSVVSDIRKSSFYGGYNEETGQMEMHYPKEHIHLSTSNELHPGWIYAAEVDVEAFEEYHRQAEEAMLWEEEDMYNEEFNQHRCTCQCPACYHGCTGHESNHPAFSKSRKPKDPFQALPTTTFALAVEDSIYRNVLDEISQASTMPCGLFYCGHHEDISHPSVMIPLVFMVCLFCAMGYVAFVTE